MKCPKCGAEMVKKSGKYGEFYSCRNFPKCRYSCDLDGTRDKYRARKGIDKDYGDFPLCNAPLVKKHGKNGDFLSCAEYPYCKYSSQMDGTRRSFNNVNINSEKYGKCPECGSPLIKKNGRHGEFLSCSDYPICTYSIDL